MAYPSGTVLGMAEQRKAREYLRVSYDRSGRERSQDEQADENAKAAAAHGLTLGRPYRENGSRSASRYGTKVRDAFAELLADLGKGRFGADVLILWESSRGSRKMAEWVTLIELCEARGVSILVTTHGREYHSANARDRRSLLEDGIDSEYESAKTSQRQLRAAAANAAAGKPHGPAPYGYTRRYDAVTRKLVAQEPDPVEAPVVREVYARLLAGHSLRAISRDLETRGVRNDSGTPFSAQHLRDMVLRPAYAGLRSHHQDRAERRARPLNGAVKGTWPALVDQATYFAVRRLLNRAGAQDGPARPRPAPAVHDRPLRCLRRAAGRDRPARRPGISVPRQRLRPHRQSRSGRARRGRHARLPQPTRRVRGAAGRRPRRG
jgi:DNA invertase Pin-like site-specific DNA recombinase